MMAVLLSSPCIGYQSLICNKICMHQIQVSNRWPFGWVHAITIMGHRWRGKPNNHAIITSTSLNQNTCLLIMDPYTQNKSCIVRYMSFHMQFCYLPLRCTTICSTLSTLETTICSTTHNTIIIILHTLHIAHTHTPSQADILTWSW